jgi:hypothetical protein
MRVLRGIHVLDVCHEYPPSAIDSYTPGFVERDVTISMVRDSLQDAPILLKHIDPSSLVVTNNNLPSWTQRDSEWTHQNSGYRRLQKGFRV